MNTSNARRQRPSSVDDAADMSARKHSLAAQLEPGLPLHHQIFMQLRSEILDGLWAGEGGFPGEVEVAERFGVAMMTSRAALRRLADEGLVVRSRGRRSQARTPEPRKADVPRLPSEFAADPRFRDFSYKLLESRMRVAPAIACESFDCPAGTELWVCSRLRSFEGRPHSVTLNIQRPELGLRHAASDLAALPMAEILRKEGIKLARLTRQIAAVLPDALVAENLKIRRDDATLLHTVILHDDQAQIVEWVRIYVHPDAPNPIETRDLSSGRVHWDVAP